MPLDPGVRGSTWRGEACSPEELLSPFLVGPPLLDHEHDAGQILLRAAVDPALGHRDVHFNVVGESFPRADADRDPDVPGLSPGNENPHALAVPDVVPEGMRIFLGSNHEIEI